VNDSHNSRHLSRFGHGDEHPRIPQDLAAYTRWRTEQVGRFISKLDARDRGKGDTADLYDGSVAAEAWAVLHPISPDGRRGDPGE
jgi:hypothetical protein